MRSKSAYVLSSKPLVVAGSFDLIDDLPQGPPTTVLYHPAWWLHPSQALRLRRKVRALNRRRPARVIVCANSPEEVWFARMAGLSAALHNQNLHARERVFYPEVAARRYDAVYAAALKPCKRLSLAKDIESLFVLTYKSGWASGWDLHREYPALGQAGYNREFWNEDAVRSLYAASGCGLALSRVEGAMWASAEYLLCGLPVVSTFSFGGRSYFRHPYYWHQVASSANDVSRAVKKLTADPPDRETVRRHFLTKVETERKRFARAFAPLCGSNETEEAFCSRVWGGEQGIAKLRMDPAVV